MIDVADRAALLDPARRQGRDVSRMDKLDRIESDVTDLRVSMASVDSKLDAVLRRLDDYDNRGDDVEGRLRTLERRAYAIPSLAAFLGLSGFALALWTALTHHV